MPLETTTEMFKKADEGGYAIGAFNVNNMEIIQGITEAAAEERAPLILQVSAGARKYAKHIYLTKLVEAAIADTDLPIALHLDHGADFDICKACVDGGFSSVMIDGSKYSFEENIALTRKVVEYAHAHGVVVEGELGTLAGIEDDVHVKADDALFTRPEEVEEFVTRTGVDSLAIAIGTSHGAYKFKPGTKPQLRFDILAEVAEKTYVSQWHLSKLLNGHTGKSFSELLNHIRIEEAKKLLKDPSLRIGDISEEVGFMDVAHFSKVFKKLEGISANEYRNSRI